MKNYESAPDAFTSYSFSQLIHTRLKQYLGLWAGAVLLVFAGTAYADHSPEHDIQNLKGGLGALEQRLWDCEHGVGGACPGTPGADGATGATGPQGDQGPQGVAGNNGAMI